MTELVIVVGLTGVGKTSVIDEARDQTDLDIGAISYGTEMLATATSEGFVDHRDELTELPRAEYDRLQDETATDIAATTAESDADVVFLDTHAALDTPVGYRPGLAAEDLETMDPTKLIQIRADATEIRRRREEDESRDRTVPSVEKLTEQQTIATQMASSCSTLARAPLSLIENPDGKLTQAADELVSVLEA